MIGWLRYLLLLQTTRVGFQHHLGTLQSSVTTVLWDLAPSSDLLEHRACATYIYTVKMLIHMTYMNLTGGCKWKAAAELGKAFSVHSTSSFFI